MTVLLTERLRLRPLTPDDAPALFRVFGDAQTMRFMPSLPHQTVAETQAHIERELAMVGSHNWAICWRDSEEALGHINYLGQTRLPGMGYIVRRDVWGQGIVPEACRAVLAFGFEDLGFDRVELWIDQDNVASQRVAQKLDFRLKGRLAMKYAHRASQHMMRVYGLGAYEWRGEAKPVDEVRFFNVQPVLLVHDVRETADFYQQKLGFGLDFLYGDPPVHGSVSRGQWSGALVNIQLSQVPPEREIVPSAYLYIHVGTNIDELCAEYRAKGVTIADEPMTYPWGMREFAVRDLNGHLLRFATPG
ncbi:MAG: GNAT family N-acetyltransferase [Ardenticatenaceae bacterium]|nr:GNAT family N-acetyltransferase [Ardenticatenaceae bacterium]